MGKAGFANRFQRLRQVSIHALRQYVAFRAHRQVNTIKPDLRRGFSHVVVVQELKMF
jgi:hypothetical protein